MLGTHAPAQRRAAQRTVRCNRLLSGLFVICERCVWSGCAGAPMGSCFSLVMLSLQGGEVPSVFMLQLLAVGPASASSAGLDEFPVAKLALRCGMCLRIVAVEDGTKDVQIGVRSGHAARIQALTAMREHQPGARLFGEEFPTNGTHWGRIRVTEPPGVLEKSRRLPAGNFAVDVHAHVVMVLQDLAAEAAVDVHPSTKPCLNVYRLG